ncbi:S-adenosyl-L-methionine-dependent methyltransferase, partial [Caulochytrium protostelioides]
MPMETWCEAYFDQKVDVKGDFMQVFEARHDWAYFNFTVGLAKFFVTQWIPELLWHSRIQDESQVRDHYDRGDDFYAAFLGPMMIYTSGITNQPNGFESLEQMQLNKLNDVAEKICLKAGDRVLDLGCGWGTWSVHAAKQGAH